MSSLSDDPRTDAQLIDAANAGSAAAFEALYRRHRAWVLRLARRFTADDELSLDVLQETFLYVLGKFPGFQLSGQFTTFLYPVVKHTAIRLRDRRGRERLPLEAAAESVAPQANDVPDLSALLAVLPEEHREVLLLRFVDGLSLEEIAAAVGVPLGTVKSRLHHALKKLRDDPRTKDFFRE